VESKNILFSKRNIRIIRRDYKSENKAHFYFVDDQISGSTLMVRILMSAYRKILRARDESICASVLDCEMDYDYCGQVYFDEFKFEDFDKFREEYPEYFI
jgi:hypothetical protein